MGLNEFSRSYDTKGLDIVVWGGRRELWRNDGRLFGESIAGESAGGTNTDKKNSGKKPLTLRLSWD